MAAQKVRFTPRLLRQVALAGTFQAQLHWNLHNRAELETYQLGPPALGACKNHTHFGPQITPSGDFSAKNTVYTTYIYIYIYIYMVLTNP